MYQIRYVQMGRVYILKKRRRMGEGKGIGEGREEERERGERRLLYLAETASLNSLPSFTDSQTFSFGIHWLAAGRVADNRNFPLRINLHFTMSGSQQGSFTSRGDYWLGAVTYAGQILCTVYRCSGLSLNLLAKGMVLIPSLKISYTTGLQGCTVQYVCKFPFPFFFSVRFTLSPSLIMHTEYGVWTRFMAVGCGNGQLDPVCKGVCHRPFVYQAVSREICQDRFIAQFCIKLQIL